VFSTPGTDQKPVLACTQQRQKSKDVQSSVSGPDLRYEESLTLPPQAVLRLKRNAEFLPQHDRTNDLFSCTRNIANRARTTQEPVSEQQCARWQGSQRRDKLKMLYHSLRPIGLETEVQESSTIADRLLLAIFRLDCERSPILSSWLYVGAIISVNIPETQG